MEPQKTKEDENAFMPGVFLSLMVVFFALLTTNVLAPNSNLALSKFAIVGFVGMLAVTFLAGADFYSKVKGKDEWKYHDAFLTSYPLVLIFLAVIPVALSTSIINLLMAGFFIMLPFAVFFMTMTLFVLDRKQERK